VNSPELHDRVRAALSAFLDGELTQAESQRVRIHLEDCPECRNELEEMRRLQRITAGLEFGGPPDGRMDELAERFSVRGPRRFAWFLLAAGLLGWLIYALVLLIVNMRPPTLRELLGGAIVAGVVLLFISVIRQRWLEYPHDRYRRVKR
jgi:anti-sigma factor RsiW